MRIGFCSTQTGWGGGENLLAHLIRGVQQAGAGVSLAAPHLSAIAEWARQQPGLELHEHPGRGRTPRAMWLLRRAFATTDVVVLNDPHSITYGGLALTGAGPMRVGIRHTCFKLNSGWKHNHLADHVVCVSESARQECLLGGVHEERLSVIHGGLENVIPDATACRAARELFIEGSHPDDHHLLAVGSLLPVKGFDTLVDAIAAANARGMRLRLWIAGEGPERAALVDQAQRAGVADRVTLLGFREDVAALMRSADLIVSASHREGLSLVVIEAMQAGKPIVATAVGGCSEVLRSDAEPVAWTFEPGDVEGFLAAAEQATRKDPAVVERVASAESWARERFSLERMASEHLSLYQRLIAARRAGRAA